MDFWKNDEVRKQLYLYLFMIILGTSIGFCICTQAALLLFLFLILAALYHFINEWKRYKNIWNLSAEIDSALHGLTNESFSDFAEGELSILQNELQKLMLRLHEQNETLKEEREQMADFLADVSHQIRTPLTALQLTITTLLGETESREQKRHLMETRKLLNRIDWLVEVLLKLAKLDAGMVQFRFGENSFEELVQKATEPFAISLELRGQTIEKELTGNFIGDLSWTTEAVANIIKNCLEHMQDGGVLRLRSQENAIFSELVIEDDGCGIEKNDLPHLFERFYKGKNSGEQSVGIGLALCRQIITGQKGVIKAENGKQGGAVFTIRFYKQIV